MTTAMLQNTPESKPHPALDLMLRQAERVLNLIESKVLFREGRELKRHHLTIDSLLRSSSENAEFGFISAGILAGLSLAGAGFGALVSYWADGYNNITGVSSSGLPTGGWSPPPWTVTLSGAESGAIILPVLLIGVFAVGNLINSKSNPENPI